MPTIAGMVERTRQGEVSPVDVVEAALSAVAAAQDRTNAITHVMADEARARARALEAERRDGPLLGVPVVVKDAFDVAGAPTTGCCAAYGSRVPTRSAASVEALEAAGAIVVAKTNQHELMAGATSALSSFGPVHNPWATERLAGGSSGGSAAAVALRAVPLALGSDTGGSIRIPASFCGVTGLKPTHGAVSLRGALPMGPALDTAGPLAASAADCAAAFRVLHRTSAGARARLAAAGGAGRATPLPRPDPGSPVEGLRIGLPRPFFSLVHADVRSAVEDAAGVLDGLGARLEWLDGPELDEGWEGFRHVWADVAHHYRELWDREGVHPEVAGLIAFGRKMTGLDYAASRERAGQIRESFERTFATVDVLLAPATPYAAPPGAATEVEVTGGVLGVHDGSPSRLTVPVNLAGVPALALPVGFSGGLPLGAQLIGPAWSDEYLLDLGRAYQGVTDWHSRDPLGVVSRRP